MPPGNLELFGATRVNTIGQALQDSRLLKPNLLWADRIPDQNATDEEIMARYQDFILIADIILDDAKAMTYDSGRLQYESTKIPNLKVGRKLNQTTLNQLDRLSGMALTGPDGDMFKNWENRTIEQLRQGVAERVEMLKIAMLTDSLSYDRLGVKLSGVSWGMPAELKITPSIPWTSTSATPLTDIATVRQIAMQKYGVDFNFMQISTPDFINITRTTEYQSQAKLIFPYTMSGSGVPAPAYPLQNQFVQRDMAQNMIGGFMGNGSPFTIEFNDNRYWMQDLLGPNYSYRFLPLGTIILTSSQFFGDSSTWDFANAIVTETQVASRVRSNLNGDFGGPTRGPVYWVTAPADLNPPNITYWCAQRGFPRKFKQVSSGVITTTPANELVTVGTTFPL